MRQKIADTDILLVVDVQNDFCPGGKLAVRLDGAARRIFAELAIPRVTVQAVV